MQEKEKQTSYWMSAFLGGNDNNGFSKTCLMKYFPCGKYEIILRIMEFSATQKVK